VRCTQPSALRPEGLPNVGVELNRLSDASSGTGGWGARARNAGAHKADCSHLWVKGRVKPAMTNGVVNSYKRTIKVAIVAICWRGILPHINGCGNPDSSFPLFSGTGIIVRWLLKINRIMPMILTSSA